MTPVDPPSAPKPGLAAAVEDVLHTFGTGGFFGAARVCVVHHGSLACDRSWGLTTLVTDAPFDVASVTKVLTTLLALRHLDLQTTVDWLPGAPTVTDLLAHRSGLPAWAPLFALGPMGTVEERRRWARTFVSTRPPDAPRPTYSDLGFLALGWCVEQATGLDLASLARRDVWEPLGRPEPAWGGRRPDAIPTGTLRPRPGNPPVDIDLPTCHPCLDHASDDDNAAWLGGVCGHAGLWATAQDLALLGEAIRLDAGQMTDGAPTTLGIRPDLLRQLWVPLAGARSLGLDTPSGDPPSIGHFLGRGPLGAAGHLGFTGCSLWIDRDAALVVACTSNAVACARPAPRLKEFRVTLHDAIACAIGL